MKDEREGWQEAYERTRRRCALTRETVYVNHFIVRMTRALVQLTRAISASQRFTNRLP